MRVGQRVMLIANHALTDLEPPRIGSIGEIVGPLDDDGDYMVSFPDHPCTVGEPEWFVFASYLIPIDEPPAVRREGMRFVCKLSRTAGQSNGDL